MKKSILILAAFAFVAFSCTKTEVKNDTPKKGINFSAYTAKPTKAAQTDVTNTNLEKFEVTAIGNGAIYFDDISFTKNASSIWVSNPEYFWPAFGLNFYAYNTPLSATASFIRNITTSGQTLVVKPSPELANQEDLVAAYAEDKKETDNNANSAIDIRFNHYLTQVIVKAKCSNPLYSVLVDGVKLANMAGEGTYTFSTNTMTATQDSINSAKSRNYKELFSERLLTSDAKEVMTDTDQKGRWYLIPQSVTAWNRLPASGTPDMTNSSNGTYLALKVKITANGGALKIYPATGDASGWMAVPIPTSWTSSPVTTPSIFAQGKRYTIILDFFGSNGAGYVDPEEPSDLDGNPSTNDNGKKIIGGPIQFDATVETWDDNDVTITISL